MSGPECPAGKTGDGKLAFSFAGGDAAAVVVAKDDDSRFPGSRAMHCYLCLIIRTRFAESLGKGGRIL